MKSRAVNIVLRWDIVIVKQLTLVVADEEVLAGQAHEDEGDPEPDRGPAP